MTDLNTEILLQAHNMLHQGDVAAAHELLHKALGVDNDASVGAPIGHRRGFDQAFITACRKNNVRAAYVLIDTQDANGMARLLSGGDADLSQLLRELMEKTR